MKMRPRIAFLLVCASCGGGQNADDTGVGNLDATGIDGGAPPDLPTVLFATASDACNTVSAAASRTGAEFQFFGDSLAFTCSETPSSSTHSRIVLLPLSAGPPVGVLDDPLSPTRFKIVGPYSGVDSLRVRSEGLYFSAFYSDGATQLYLLTATSAVPAQAFSKRVDQLELEAEYLVAPPDPDGIGAVSYSDASRFNVAFVPGSQARGLCAGAGGIVYATESQNVQIRRATIALGTSAPESESVTIATIEPTEFPQFGMLGCVTASSVQTVAYVSRLLPQPSGTEVQQFAIMSFQAGLPARDLYALVPSPMAQIRGAPILDGGYAYFEVTTDTSDPTAGKVLRVPVTGGADAQVVVDGLNFVSTTNVLAIHDGHLYVLQRGVAGTSDATLAGAAIAIVRYPLPTP